MLQTIYNIEQFLAYSDSDSGDDGVVTSLQTTQSNAEIICSSKIIARGKKIDEYSHSSMLNSLSFLIQTFRLTFFQLIYE